MRLVLAALVAFASSSDQISWRWWVFALITTIGWPGSYVRETSVIGTAPVFWKAVGLSSPGTCVTISWPGLKPSLRFQSVGSIGLPAAFLGIEARSRLTRRPVSVVLSGTVK